jgi:hypothetical protein
MSPLRPSVPHYDTLYPLGSYVPSTGLCYLYYPLPSLWPYIPSAVLCPHQLSSVPSTALYGPLPPLRPLSLLCPSVPSITLCPLYSSLSSLLLSVSSTAPFPLYGFLRLLYGPLSPVWPCLPSIALSPFYGGLSPFYCPLYPLPLFPLPCLSTPLFLSPLSLCLSTA